MLPKESYTCDANGNPTGSGHVVGAGNRLISDGTYTYDAEGNRFVRPFIGHCPNSAW